MRLLGILIALALPAWADVTLGQLRLLDFGAKTPCVVQSVSGSVNLTMASSCTIPTGPAFIYLPMTVAQAETAKNTGNYGRGYYNVTRVDATHYTLATEMYTDVTVATSTVAAGDLMVPLTTYYIRQGPRLFLDGPIAKGAWSAFTTYRADESVTSGGNLYMSIADGNTNNAPPNATWWVQLDPTKVGPGTFSAGLRDTSATGKANTANQPFSILQGIAQSFTTRNVQYDFDLTRGWGVGGFSNAYYWFATGNTTAYNLSLQLALQPSDGMLGGPACVINTSRGYCSRTTSLDYSRYWAGTGGFEGLAAIYDTLSSAQKATAADQILNDMDRVHNGIENNGGTNCTEAQPIQVVSSISYSASAVTGSGFNALTDLQAGSILYYADGLNQYYAIGRVATKDSDTHLTLQVTYAPVTGSQTTWYYTHPFEYGGEHTCGLINFFRHHPSSPYMIPTQSATTYWNTDVGELGASDAGFTNNRTTSSLLPYIEAGLQFCDVDARGCRLAEQAINYYMIAQAFSYKSRASGFNGHGTQYGGGRVEAYDAAIAICLQNSLTVTPPGIVDGVYQRHVISAYQYASFVGAPQFALPWDTSYGADASTGLGEEPLSDIMPAMLEIAHLYPSDTTIPQMYDFFVNRRGDWSKTTQSNGWWAALNYPAAWLYWEPSITPVGPTALPLQRGMIYGDIAACIASGLFCRPDTESGMAISQTGWANTDSQVIIHGNTALPIFNQDADGVAGGVEIAQSNGTTACCTYTGVTSAYLLSGNGYMASYGAANAPFSGVSEGNTLSVFNGSSDLWKNPEYARIDRWAGNAETGVSTNDYAYASVNFTPQIRSAANGYSSSTLTQVSSYTAAANVTAARRDILHLKSGSGIPSEVIVYDSMATGTANQLRSYWHYGTADWGGIRHPSWVTTYDATNKAVVLDVPTVGRLSAKYLAVPGSSNTTVAIVRQDTSEAWCQGTNSGHNPEATCVGNFGPHFGTISYPLYAGTYRVTACASEDGSTCANETGGEWISVFRPSTSSADTMPTLEQPTCTATGGNCVTVQVDDATYPKVAVFARNGALVSAVSFTSTHSGTAAYVITGLAAGSYTVTRGGTAIASVTAATGDTSVEFNSTAGAIALSQATLPVPSIVFGGAFTMGGKSVVH